MSDLTITAAARSRVPRDLVRIIEFEGESPAAVFAAAAGWMAASPDAVVGVALTWHYDTCTLQVCHTVDLDAYQDEDGWKWRPQPPDNTAPVTAE